MTTKDTLLSERATARYLGIKHRTLAAWRDEEARAMASGSEPMFPAPELDASGAWCYRHSDLHRWLCALPPFGSEIGGYPQLLRERVLARFRLAA